MEGSLNCDRQDTCADGVLAVIDPIDSDENRAEQDLWPQEDTTTMLIAVESFGRYTKYAEFDLVVYWCNGRKRIKL